MTTHLEFTGEPFDALALDTTDAAPAAEPFTTQPPPPAPRPTEPPAAPVPATAFVPSAAPVLPPAGTVPVPARTVPVPADAPAVAATGTRTPGVGASVRELRISVARAHEAALRANAALTRRLLLAGPQNHNQSTGTTAGYTTAATQAAFGGPAGGRAASVPASVLAELTFKPLARTTVTALDQAALARLGRGDAAGVFGPAYEPGEKAAPVATDHGFLLSVAGLSARGGAHGRGGLTARTVPLGAGDRESAARAVVAAATEAAQVAALSLGLHLCLADATLSDRCPGLPEAAPWTDVAAVTGPVELRLDLTEVDLVPRPHLTADAEVFAGGARIGSVRGIGVAVVERPGASVGPDAGGVVPGWLGRLGAYGEPVLLSEFHLAHCCRGDQGLAFGPEFTRYSGRKATRPPDGGLLLVDRMMELDGERGVLDRGSYRTEYDSHADSWYYLDNANASMPNCVYMETSLQSALLLGYYVGPTLAMPDDNISLRNLGGTATVLREVDLRDKTITEQASLLSTSLVPGSSLQSFSYTQSVDGEPYYEGETLFGYFSETAMANQTGLDAGRYVPSWLESTSDAGSPPARRTIDVAGRRADPSARLVSRGRFALLDDLVVVDGGGKFGLGYLWASRAIDPSDWVFARHFRYDPVIPGSFGVEAVIQAMQEWLLDGGLGDGLVSPSFILPVGVPFTWKYRGQFLPTDGSFTLEIHIKSLQRRRGRVRVIAEASMWKPGLRIYHMSGVATELREEGAPAWTD
ncbi:MAG TPA: beta-ketoacyl synthase [Trebonia sp.]